MIAALARPSWSLRGRPLVRRGSCPQLRGNSAQLSSQHPLLKHRLTQRTKRQLCEENPSEGVAARGRWSQAGAQSRMSPHT